MADLSPIQNGSPMTIRQQIVLTAKLSLPAIMAQLSNILMQYIDASMVGQLGTNPSAAVGLVGTSLWLFWGVCSAMTVGFTVQVAHKIGARRNGDARSILRQSFTSVTLFSILITAIGLIIGPFLPYWLGGGDEIAGMSSTYFMIFIVSLPGLSLSYLAGGMLRCAGNMKVPSILNSLMAVLDICFNWFLIFPTRSISFAGMEITVPGADLGVAGAAIGTVLAELVTAGAMIYFLVYKEDSLKLKGTTGSFLPDRKVIFKALKISTPMALEHAVICGAQIMITVIVAPLGVIAIAANSFAVTAESLCYMPGYGIGDAATTLVGQSHGAGRRDLTRRFGYITVGMGMAVMSFMGVLMWIFAPYMMELMSPVPEISSLGTEIIRIEAWAEPMFAAAIVSYGVFVGVGDTLVPACMNFSSIWLVRLPLAAILAPIIGLRGVWIAMCVELSFRGLIFLIRLKGRKWTSKTGNENIKTEIREYENIENEDSIIGSGKDLF